MTRKLFDGTIPCNEIFQQFIPYNMLAPKIRTLGRLVGRCENLSSLPLEKKKKKIYFPWKIFLKDYAVVTVQKESKMMHVQKRSFKLFDEIN